MRELLFKNLTSTNKKRKIISSSEVIEKQGIRSIISRHFVYIIKEIQTEKQLIKPLPYLYILKEHNTKEKREKFFCRIKGSIYLIRNGKLYLVLFAHSLKISFMAITYPPGVVSSPEA